MTVLTGFHEGELAVQERAGVRAQAARLGGAMLSTPDLNGGMSDFLADRDFAVIAARDADSRLWTSPLFSSPGFLEARDRMLRIHATPVDGDPLHDIAEGEPIGMLAIEFATRRRVRVNGTVVRVGAGRAGDSADADGLAVSVDQAYGNCPKYIQVRHLEHVDSRASSHAQRSVALSDDDSALITRADTFFLGTTHPTRGVDASHRGGSPGFVRVENGQLWWPDYAGNNMFNSFGNLAVNPSAALLFIDFDAGTTLHISGTATVEWLPPGVDGDDGGTGRRVRFAVESVVSGRHLGLRSDAPRLSPHNPPII
jgi:predicted pyridoxine 5'-phosphate oxidase superfamily flavin-nucleotide-binding protein